MFIQATGIAHTEFFRADFSDIDVLAREIGFDATFRPLDPGPCLIPASLLKSERVAVGKLHTNCGYHQRGCAPAGTVSFGLPVVGASDWFGAPYADQSILPFTRHRE